VTGWQAVADVPFPALARVVDEVLLEPAGDDRWRLRGRALIRPDDPSLPGHFPDYPTFPGVLLLECLRQAVHAAWRLRTGAGLELHTVRSARFLAPVRPGDELHTDATLGRNDDGGWLVTAVCRVGDGDVARLRADFREERHA
jgi:3-hydroxyacyl-[acyl-carrier-protein] dehydratase